MSLFQELLTIKRFREDQAVLALEQQRRVLAQKHEHSVQAYEQLTQFREQSRQWEQDRYRDLCTRSARVNEILDTLNHVAHLRQGEQDRVSHLEQAQDQERQEALVLDQRREVHHHCARAVQKFVELIDLDAVGLLREQERLEDLDMDEVTQMARDRKEWHVHDDREME